MQQHPDQPTTEHQTKCKQLMFVSRCMPTHATLLSTTECIATVLNCTLDMMSHNGHPYGSAIIIIQHVSKHMKKPEPTRHVLLALCLIVPNAEASLKDVDDIVVGQQLHTWALHARQQHLHIMCITLAPRFEASTQHSNAEAQQSLQHNSCCNTSSPAIYCSAYYTYCLC